MPIPSKSALTERTEGEHYGKRIASITRKTKETDITLTLNLDGTGQTRIDTGIPFFDHMLDGFARHGLFDLDVKASGDLDVDSHHTIEDTAIVLGQAIRQALGEKAGIRRYGYFILPWMKCWPYPPLICADARISDTTRSSPSPA